MKKICAFLLILGIMLSLAACLPASDKGAESSAPTSSAGTNSTPLPDSSGATLSGQNEEGEPQQSEDEIPTAERAVAAFVEANKYEILTAKESFFVTSAGYTCTSNIEAVGLGFVINLNINELEGLSREKKDALQVAYNEMSETVEQMLAEYQAELPELEYFKINICEADGDLLAVIKAEI